MNFRLILVAVVLFMAATCSTAAVPTIVNYQGFLGNSSGTALDTTVSVVFTFYDGPNGGATVLWSETQPTVGVSDGIFHVLLGSVIPIPPSVFGTDSVYLGVTVGGDSEATPRTRIASSAYAFVVNSVDGAAGGTIAGDLFIDGSATVDSTLAVNKRATFNSPVVIFGGDTDTTFIYSSNALAEGVYLAPGSSCWRSIDPTDSCGGGGGGTVTSVDGLAGGTITSSVTINGKLNVGGGSNDNSGTQAFVSGSNNKARASYSTISGGGGATAIDSNSATGTTSAVSGGRRNSAMGTESTVGGGMGNIAGGTNSVVGGGYFNKARGNYAFIGGGGGSAQVDSNQASGMQSVIGGGARNQATAHFATVLGGRANAATDTAATICGGLENSASGDTCFIGGGYSNLNQGDWAVITGGYDNSINTAGEASTISGGANNTANGAFAVVGGGNNNSASGNYAAVSGGNSNVATGVYAMIPGGNNCGASGRYAFAAGKQATASHHGSFVWSDSTGGLSSYGTNTFSARAVGGYRLYASATVGVTLAPGGSAWDALSDSTVKRNARLVDTRMVLDKVARLPIKQWSYMTQDPSIEHIGPMAQDFWSLFQVGDDSLRISTIDPSGIALAAIQELKKQNDQLTLMSAEQQRQLQELKARLDQIAPVKLSRSE